MADKPNISSDAWACVPVGGVGTGSIGFGPDACFRHICINNNRVPADAIPLSLHSGLFVRLTQPDGGVYLRALRASADTPPVPAPPALPPEALKAHLAYPLAHFETTDDSAPAAVSWNHLAPLVPYDYDGSTLPVLVTRAYVENTSETPLEVSLLFCLENLLGQTGAQSSETPAQGRSILVEEERRYVKRFEQREGPAPSEIQADPRRANEAPPPPREEDLPPNNGVCFGNSADPALSATGEHALLLRAAEALEITVNAFDPGNPEECARFWNRFSEDGGLPQDLIAEGAQHVGAVCGRAALPPKTGRWFEFLLVWYCPRFEQNGEDMGVVYAGARRNAHDVAQHALQHLTYFQQSVDAWQKRFAESSLPTWMSELLLNSACILTSNTLCTYNESYGVAESPATGRTACLSDSRLFSSLGTALYFPRYNDTELTLLANAEQPQSTGRLPMDLGAWRLKAGELNHEPPLRVRLAANFIVMAYRDFTITGKLVRLQGVFPVLRAVIAALATLDRDGDGLPELDDSPAHTIEGIAGRGVSCIDAGLCVVALRAYALLCEKLRNPGEAKRFNLLAKRATLAFDNRYWDESLGYFRLYNKGCGSNAEACHAGQLTGAWYATFLGLGGLFDPQHIEQALTAIGTHNMEQGFVVAARRPDGTPCTNEDGDSTDCHSEDAWTGLTLGPYASMLVYRGRVAEGIAVAQRLCEAQREHSKSPFNCYDRWNPQSNIPADGALPRHASAMAIWHLHYAVEGFLFSAPDQRLRVMPNLPGDVHSISAPIMTPLCLGWLNYKVDDTGGYRQRVRIRLDSPIQVRSFELRIPNNERCVRVRLKQTTSDWVPIDYGLRPDGNALQLFVSTRSPMLVAADIFIEVVRATPPPAATEGNSQETKAR